MARPDQARPPVGPELLAQLLRDHGSALELYASQWTRCPEDSVQEALIELARQQARPGDVVAWLYRVVRNRAINQARSVRRRRTHEAAAATLRAESFVAPGESAMDAAETIAALVALTEQEREVVIARVWGGLTFQQIATVMEISTSTAHRRYLEG